MATTIPNVYIPDILEICQEAAERAGVDFTSGGMLRSAKRSIDLLGIEWGNEGLNLWTLDEETITLKLGVADYDLPIDTLTVLNSSSLRIVQNGRNKDLPIDSRDFADFAAIPDKSRPGRPYTYFVQRTANPKITFHPVPDVDSVYTFVYWRLRRGQRVGYTETPDVHPSFIPALTAGVAWYMAMKSLKKDLNLIAYLNSEYQKAFEKAKYGDNDRSVFIVAPARYH